MTKRACAVVSEGFPASMSRRPLASVKNASPRSRVDVKFIAAVNVQWHCTALLVPQIIYRPTTHTYSRDGANSVD